MNYIRSLAPLPRYECQKQNWLYGAGAGRGCLHGQLRAPQKTYPPRIAAAVDVELNFSLQRWEKSYQLRVHRHHHHAAAELWTHLEVTAGLLWEMAVARVRHKFSSLIWFSSGSSDWDSSFRKLFCSVLGFISRGWTIRKHFLCSGSTRLLLRWMAASIPQGHSKWWMKLKPPKRAEQL